LLVVNKPAGLVCHPTKGDEYSSLISRARLYLKNVVTPHLVHRLDRETSGVVLFAKNAAVARELGKIWETRTVTKEYLAIVHGHVREDEGVIDAPLGRDEASRVAIKDCVRSDGAPAQTAFRVEKRFSRLVNPVSGSEGEGGNESKQPGLNSQQSAKYSLLRLLPRTGRKHQIRIHLAHLGHPIVGDKIYGGDEDLYLALVENRLTDEQRTRLILGHHALHAVCLQFERDGQSWRFFAAPESGFSDFCGGGCIFADDRLNVKLL
jgi:23S rRNA pseudouridine1911/1915/1917 synthase